MDSKLILIIILAVTAACSVFAFSPYNQWWILFSGYLVLFVLLYGSRPKQGFLHGALFGLFYWAAALHWMIDLFARFNQAHQVIMIALIAGIVLIISMISGLAGFAAARAVYLKKNAFSWCVVYVPAVFCLSEWTREWLFTGLPLYQAGFTIVDLGFKRLLPAVGMTGINLCFYSLGDILQEYNKNATAAIYRRMIPRRGQTLYTRTGSLPVAVFCLTACLFLLIRNYKPFISLFILKKEQVP